MTIYSGPTVKVYWIDLSVATHQAGKPIL